MRAVSPRGRHPRCPPRSRALEGREGDRGAGEPAEAPERAPRRSPDPLPFGGCFAVGVGGGIRQALPRLLDVPGDWQREHDIPGN